MTNPLTFVDMFFYIFIFIATYNLFFFKGKLLLYYQTKPTDTTKQQSSFCLLKRKQTEAQPTNEPEKLILC